MDGNDALWKSNYESERERRNEKENNFFSSILWHEENNKNNKNQQDDILETNKDHIQTNGAEREKVLGKAR